MSARRSALRSWSPLAALVAAPLFGCGAAPVAKPQAPVVAPAKAGPFAALALPKDARVIWATYRETWRNKVVEGPSGAAGAKRPRLTLDQRALIGLELLRPDAAGFVAPPPRAAGPAAEAGVKELVRVHAIAFGPGLAPIAWDSHEFEDTPTPRESPPLAGPIAKADAGCEAYAAIDAFLRDFPTLAIKTGMPKAEFRARALPIVAALLEALVTSTKEPGPPAPDAIEYSLGGAAAADDAPPKAPPPPLECGPHGLATQAFPDALGRVKTWVTAGSDEDDASTGGPTKAKPTAADLPFGDPQQRWSAVLRAFELGADAAPIVEDALVKGDAETRRAALIVAWALGGPASLTSAALRRADDAEPQVRAYAWFALAALEPPTRAAIPALLDLLKAGSPATRQRVLGVVDQMGGEARGLAPKLGELANGADEPLALFALSVLESLGANAVDAVPALGATLASPSIARRRGALNVVQRLRGAAKELLPAVVARAKDADADVRELACAALGGLGADASQVVPALLEALGDAAPAVRLAALHALRPFAADAAVTPQRLTPLLRDADPSVRTEAASALGAMGAKAAAATPSLVELAERDPSSGVKHAALGALGGVGPAARAALPTIMKHVKGDDAQLRRTAIRAAVDLGPAAASELPTLIKIAREVSTSFASSVLERAGQKMGRAAAPTLLAHLAGDDRELRRGAVRGLGALGKDGGPEVPKLLAHLDDEAIRYDVFRALGAIGPSAAAAVPKLVELIEKQASYRRDAFSTLSKIGAPALPRLLAIMQDKKRLNELRTAAANAILDAGPVAAPHTLAVLELADELGLYGWVIAGFDKLGKAAPAPLFAATRDKRAGVRAQAISALGYLWGEGKRDAVIALLGLMKDPETAAPARRALENMGRSRALPELNAVLADKSKGDLHEYARSYVEKWK